MCQVRTIGLRGQKREKFHFQLHVSVQLFAFSAYRVKGVLKISLSERTAKTTSEKYKGAKLKNSFADYCLLLGNPEEAAIRAGIDPGDAFSEAARLIGTPAVKKRMAERESICGAGALSGLRRLAFGRINDALMLLREDAPGPEAKNLDLFSVAEIKRPKGGGIEIKFFDRLEALTRLAELEAGAGGESSADSFFAALRGSADRDVEV